MKRISTLGLTVALMLWGAVAQAVELMHWERLPLAVPLVINQERVVFIDEAVRVGVPSTLTGKLRVQSTGGTLYLRASEAIAPTRLQLQSVTTGEIILLDIAATPGDQPLEPVRILKNAQGQATEAESSTVPVPERTPIPVALTRYAAQKPVRAAAHRGVPARCTPRPAQAAYRTADPAADRKRVQHTHRRLATR